ncbi:MAG: hypothetical protein ACFB21_15970 [Opitutales bacterium]
MNPPALVSVGPIWHASCFPQTTMFQKLFRVFLGLSIVAGAAALSGCNTVEGVGEDIDETAENLGAD